MSKYKYYISIVLAVHLLFFILLPGIVDFVQTVQDIALNQRNIHIDMDEVPNTETEENSKSSESSKSSKSKLFEQAEDCILSHFSVSFIQINRLHNFLSFHKKLSACCLQIFSPPPNLI